MALEAFTVSEPLTMGVELELQLLDTLDFDLAPRAQDLLRALEAIAKGDKMANIRAKVGDRCEDHRQQVECLLDQATDPNILARFWQGWTSFA